MYGVYIYVYIYVCIYIYTCCKWPETLQRSWTNGWNCCEPHCNQLTKRYKITQWKGFSILSLPHTPFCFVAQKRSHLLSQNWSSRMLRRKKVRPNCLAGMGGHAQSKWTLSHTPKHPIALRHKSRRCPHLALLSLASAEKRWINREDLTLAAVT